VGRRFEPVWAHIHVQIKKRVLGNDCRGLPPSLNSKTMRLFMILFIVTGITHQSAEMYFKSPEL
jgi:hypothetical protein